MEKLFFSITGYLFGFIFSSLVWGTGENGIGIIPNLRIPLGIKVLALHHWMLFLVLIVLLLAIRNSFSDKIFYFILGICVGGLNQGLTYKDWYIFLK